LLTGLNQNGVWLVDLRASWGHTDIKATGGTAEPNLSIVPTRTQMNYAKRGKPVFSPQGKADCKESRWECG